MLLAVSFFMLAWFVSLWIGVPIRDPEGTLLGKRVVAPFLFMTLFMLADVYVRARSMRRSSPRRIGYFSSIRTIYVERWWWQRTVLAFIGFTSFHVTYLAYRNLKSFLVLTQWATHDQLLLHIDRLMAFGHDPGPALHALLGTGVSAHVLSAVYLAFIPWVPVSVAAALTFMPRIRDGFVYVVAANFTWILGTASYFLVPTLGPFGGKRTAFDDLPLTGVTQLQDSLVRQRADLYADPLGSPIVQSVAGFASLHVGIVFMALLVMRHYGYRRLMYACWAALIPTIVATIYFGWHYIIDDIAGLGIGWASVALAVRLVGRDATEAATEVASDEPAIQLAQDTAADAPVALRGRTQQS